MGKIGDWSDEGDEGKGGSKEGREVLAWTAWEMVVSSPDKLPPGIVEILGEFLRSCWAWGSGGWLAVGLDTQSRARG